MEINLPHHPFRHAAMPLVSLRRIRSVEDIIVCLAFVDVFDQSLCWL